jgi:hypothetical protein
MTPLGKMILAALSVALVIGATIALRQRPATAPAHPQLTPAQLAEIKPPEKAPEPPKAVSVPAHDGADVAEPDEPDLEDGSGS